MSQTKTQHYVPQSYLSRFTSRNNAVFVFDKIQGKIFETNIINVACENYFYDVPKAMVDEIDFDPQLVEKLLAQTDEKYSRTINSLLKAIAKHKKRRVIKPDQKSAMAYFITLQLLRTRGNRNLIIEHIQKVGDTLLSKTPDYSPDDFEVVVDKEWVSLFQSGFMLSPETREVFMNALLGHIWFIGINDTGQPFYTSDSPVVRRAHYRDPFRSYAGLASEGIEIVLPLTPWHNLVLCERTAFKQYKGLDCKTLDLNLDNVKYYNSLQVDQSYRQIYCSSNDFELALKICEERPEICSSDRDRVEIN